MEQSNTSSGKAASRLQDQKRIPTLLKRVGWGLFIVSIPLCTLLFFVERYLMMTWGDLSLDEIVYHLKTSIKGTDPEMVFNGLLHYGLPALLICLLIFAGLFILSKRKRFLKVFVPLILAIEVMSLIFMKIDLDRRLNFTAYISRAVKGETSDFIGEHYVSPADVTLTFPEQKRNLIFIFLESLEMTYSDTGNGGAFSRNVIPNLTRLAQENEDFSGSEDKLNGGIALPGATWTMGAMFAYGTGAPLKIALNGNRMKNRDSFFPGMQSLGTVLEKEGYKQELLIGSDAVFGGRDVFYETHGNFQIEDYKAAVEQGRIDKNYKTHWGFEDEKLFAFAKEDLNHLAQEGKPFNLTMLTVDTHFEDGSLCRLCKDEFGEQYANVFACSDRQVSDFVDWIRKQDFYKDTTIVLCGDHPTMDRDFCQNVPSDYQRRTFISVINGACDMDPSVKEEYREYSTFDLFPTTLAAMGVDIDGNRLGLGVNLYSGDKTLIEKYGLKKCQKELDMPSPFMENMSGIKLTEKTLKHVSHKAKIIYHDKGEGENDSVDLSLRYVHRYLNRNAVKDMELEVTDKETGEKKTYKPKLTIPNKNDPNVFYHEITLPLHGKSLDDYEGAYYIYINGVDHYKIADFAEDLVEDKDD